VKVSELAAALDDYDQEMEVQVRIFAGDLVEEDDIRVSEFEGEYCTVDEKGILIEHGKLTIIGDWNPE
jgi:hypothetical protein